MSDNTSNRLYEILKEINIAREQHEQDGCSDDGDIDYDKIRKLTGVDDQYVLTDLYLIRSFRLQQDSLTNISQMTAGVGERREKHKKIANELIASVAKTVGLIRLLDQPIDGVSEQFLSLCRETLDPSWTRVFFLISHLESHKTKEAIDLGPLEEITLQLANYLVNPPTENRPEREKSFEHVRMVQRSLKSGGYKVNTTPSGPFSKALRYVFGIENVQHLLKHRDK